MAVAGCINAYDRAGCFLTTFQQLQSDNIGVSIDYTAPSEYGRRQLDYIKYTDKCGCTCCLTGENELRIVATQGVIKNFTLTNDDTNEVVNVKRTDLFGSNWKKTVVRYKTGSFPTSVTDGTLAVEELVQNQYSSTGFDVSGLDDETTYYFSVFAIAQDDTVIVVQNKSITTDFSRKPGINTIAYFPFINDVNDHSGNGNVLENTQYLSKQTLGYKRQFSQGNTGYSIMAEFSNSNAKFISVWYNVSSSSGNSTILCMQKYGAVGYNTSHLNSGLSGKIAIFTNSSRSIGATANGMSFNARHHFTIGYDGSKVLISKDGVQSTLYNGSGYNFGNSVQIVGGGNSTNMTAFVSEFICEDRCRTQAEITEYYNKTKSIYGL